MRFDLLPVLDYYGVDYNPNRVTQKVFRARDSSGVPINTIYLKEQA